MPEARILISYARADGEEFAQNLLTRIEAEGIPCWLDHTQMKEGQDWQQQIKDALNTLDLLFRCLQQSGVEVSGLFVPRIEGLRFALVAVQIGFALGIALESDFSQTPVGGIDFIGGFGGFAKRLGGGVLLTVFLDLGIV